LPGGGIEPLPEESAWQRLPAWALVASLLVHGLVLCIPRQSPKEQPAASRLSARLAPPAPKQPAVEPKPAKAAKPAQAPPRPSRNVLAMDKSKTRTTAPSPRQWSVAEKAEMDNFLNDLNRENRPPPSLAQRSLAMAREYGREQAHRDDASEETLERLPNSAPPDPFSLEMYLDAIVKKLNRSAGFVRNDPRAKGMRSALVRVQINPNGSLRRFEVLNAGDQQEEIAFVKSVVEQAVPFANFPADLVRSARSLGMLICIRPTGAGGGGGFGFSRSPNGQRC
jgi:hypothetical protein